MENNDLEIIQMTIDKSIEETKEGTDFIYSSLKGITDEELILGWVTPYNMQLIFDICRVIQRLKKCKTEELDAFISFTRFVRGHDKIFCDWCSINNGLFQFFYDIILDICNNKEKILSFNVPEKLKDLVNRFNQSSHEEYTHVSSNVDKLLPFTTKMDEIELPDSEKSRIISEIEYVMMFRDMLKQIEERWCPFKHHKKLKVDGDHYKYNSHVFDDVQMAQHLLKRDGRVNKKNHSTMPEHDLFHTNGVTIFDDFMKHMKKLIT